MGDLFTITGRMDFGISLAGRKNSLILYSFIFQREVRRKKYVSRSDRDFSWLTVYMSACHGVSFWRDVVF